MRQHRLVRFVAILLFIAAAIVLLLGVYAALRLASQGLGGGWGPGSAAWLWLPILVSTVLNAAFLMVFGSVLLFLSKIETNLSAARNQRGSAGRRAPAPVPPTRGLFAPEPERRASEEVPAPPTVVEAETKATAPDAGQEGSEQKDVAAPVVVAVAETAGNGASAGEPIVVAAATPATEAEQAVRPRVEILAEEPPVEPDAAAASQAGAVKLPGTEEAARIAKEMAAAEAAAKAAADRAAADAGEIAAKPKANDSDSAARQAK